MKDKTFFIVPLLLLFIFVTGCALSKDPYHLEIRSLQKGKQKDDSSFVYHLPYEQNRSHLLIQGYFSGLTHKRRAALDFKMKKGTKICAVRDGVVIRIKKDGKKGGGDIKYRNEGNYIVIEHADSSRSGYWHLQHNGVFVDPGDTVKRGQVIGLSGKTGYTFVPHLHFIVWKYDRDGRWKQIATRFLTNKGIRYLRPFRFYRNQIAEN